MIRILVVDDEPPARRKLIGFLQAEDDVEVVGEAGSGPEALEAIVALRPDAVFLDVQMPEMDGFEVLQAIDADRRPAVIFATAYDRFALRAFEVSALDYLLKPFDRGRLRQSLDRLRSQLTGTGELTSKLDRLLGHLHRERRWAQRIMVRSQGRVIFVSVSEIDWIESAANYVELHVGRRSHLLRETLRTLEERLDPTRFVRVHRSAIVNIDRVREIHPFAKNDFVVVLEGQAGEVRVRMSRRYRDNLERLADLS